VPILPLLLATRARSNFSRISGRLTFLRTKLLWIAWILLMAFIAGISHWLRIGTSFYYDEVFDLVSTLGIPNHCKDVHAVTNAPIALGCFPIQSGVPYVGALRTYFLWFPIHLKLISPFSLTFINLTILAVTMWQIHRFLKILEFRKRTVIFPFIIFCTFPFIWFASAFDFGPSTFNFLLRTLFLISLSRWFLEGGVIGIKLFLCFELLIWGKLDSLFFLFFPLLAMLFMVVKQNVSSLRNRITVIFMFFSYVLGVLYALRVSNSNQSDLLNHFFKMLWHTIPRNLAFSNFNLVYPGQVLDSYVVFGRCLVVIFVAASILNVFHFFGTPKLNWSPRSWVLLTVSSTTLITLLATCLVGNATAPWHTYLIFPSAFLSFVFWLERISKVRSPLRISLVSALAVFCFTFSMILNFVFLTPKKSAVNPLFSEVSFKEVVRGVDNFHLNHDGALLFVNWGEYNRFVLQTNKSSVELHDVWDAWPWFNDGDAEETKRFLKWATNDGPLASYRKVLFVQNNYKTPGLNADIESVLDLSSGFISKTYAHNSEAGNQIIFTLWEKNLE
jgi:hypothetical protein